MSRSLILTAALLLTACKDETPPHWEDVCVKQEFSHFITTFVMAGKAMVPVNTPVYRCTETERQCVVGADFQGDRQCPTQ